MREGPLLDCRSKGYVASTASCYEPGRVARATLGRMRSTPEQDQKLRARLKEAVDLFAGGSADKLARRIGYTNGGYIREILGPKHKPVREALIDRVQADKEMADWFDKILSPVTIGDLAGRTGSSTHPPDGVRAPYSRGLSRSVASRRTSELGGVKHRSKYGLHCYVAKATILPVH